MDSSPVVDTMQQNGTTRKRKRDLAPALDGDLPESESKRKSQNTEDTLTAGTYTYIFSVKKHHYNCFGL